MFCSMSSLENFRQLLKTLFVAQLLTFIYYFRQGWYVLTSVFMSVCLLTR